MLLSEAIEIFLSDSLITNKTKDNYRYALNIFFKFNKNCELNELTILDVVKFQGKCKLSTPSRIWTALIALKSLLNFFNDIYDYPCLKSVKIKAKRPQGTPIPHVTEEYLFELVKKINGDDIFDVRNRALILFMYSTGVRVNELCQIKLSDVDIVNRLVLIHGKGDKDRVAIISKDSLKYLNEYLCIRKDKYVWLFPSHSNNHARNHQPTPDSIKKLLKDLSVNHKVTCGFGNDRNLSPHMIRKTNGKVFYSRTKDIRATQEELGHSDIKTTQIYTQVALTELQELHDKVFSGWQEYKFEIKKNGRVVSRVTIESESNSKKYGTAAKAAINQLI